MIPRDGVVVVVEVVVVCVCTECIRCSLQQVHCHIIGYVGSVMDCFDAQIDYF